MSEEKFRDCAHQLYDNGIPARSQAIDDFLDNRGTGEYAVTWDYSMTQRQLGNFLRGLGYKVTGPQVGGYANEHPNTLYFAGDIFPNGVLGDSVDI